MSSHGLCLTILSLVLIVSGARAAPKETANMTAISGSWNTTGAPVTINAGVYGQATVSMSFGNGAYLASNPMPFIFNGVGGYNVSLTNGDTLQLDRELVIAPGAPAGQVGFVDITISLLTPGAQFSAGDYFIARSLDSNAAAPTRYNRFAPLSQLGAPDSAAIPSDGVSPMVVLGSIDGNTVYGPQAATGVSSGLAFPILSDTNSLTTRFYVSGNPQGIAFSMALTTAPEPGSAALLLPAIGLMGIALQRRKRSI